MKTLTLDCKKWICGNNSQIKDNTLGKGAVRLLNNEGYMCCLGQFSCQMNSKVTKKNLLGVGSPSYLREPIRGLSYKETGCIFDTNLSTEAMAINDDEDTSIPEKVSSLKKLFKTKGYNIKVINLPKRFENKK